MYDSYKLNQPFITFLLDCFETNQEWCETNINDMVETYTTKGDPVIRKEFLEQIKDTDEAIRLVNIEIKFHSHLVKFIELCEQWITADRQNNYFGDTLEVPQTLGEFYDALVPPIDKDPEAIGDTWCWSFGEFQEFCEDRVEQNDERYTQQYVDWIEHEIMGYKREEA